MKSLTFCNWLWTLWTQRESQPPNCLLTISLTSRIKLSACSALMNTLKRQLTLLKIISCSPRTSPSFKPLFPAIAPVTSLGEHFERPHMLTTCPCTRLRTCLQIITVCWSSSPSPFSDEAFVTRLLVFTCVITLRNTALSPWNKRSSQRWKAMTLRRISTLRTSLDPHPRISVCAYQNI